MAEQMNPELPGDFDRLLRRQLSVEPSAAFLPKVRERIAAQSSRRAGWSPWTVGFGAAAVLVLLVVWLKPQPSPVGVPAPSQAAVTPKGQPSGPSADAGRDVPGFRRSRPVRRPRQPMAVAAVTSPHEPVVIVDERQSVAVAAVYRLVLEGKLTSEAFAHTTPQSLEPIRNQLIPLSVRPLDVSPITVGGVLPMENERH